MPNIKSSINNMIKDKKRYKQFTKDVAALPAPYAATVTALTKYMWNFARSGAMMDVLEEILRIFQENAAENVPVLQIVGDDPVEFAENIMAQYPDELWLIKYRNQLRKQVAEAEQS
ncbi:DUF1048 domain-containing protein [Lacticaseibacillus pantheris]|jgi:DNA-binding ferritin-like protein (Dps family)|uniref:DUF1048 domain-containing protein n=1 Tax=Lacticaseibacillus pantheris DSM 15945 = JCM 12539 = NBRC 106106 TaxID=1423783 RepID=A0A0R1U046_9LACO|nr:DUF1048 domain-containing protein [Lacticaseibacillus pantheris]KRL85860.1 hypothetical protein FC50_GL001255 [Lacticaseibacillus pantheris DSM 15945 = JCM 12539 = NBRC 106106]WKF84929.1 DUF1048 domain-containing protein [Lacticaseibacillus pantheris]